MPVSKIVVSLPVFLWFSVNVLAQGALVPVPPMKPALDLQTTRSGEELTVPPQRPPGSTRSETRLGKPFTCELPFAEYSKAQPVDPGNGCGFYNVVVLTALKEPGGEAIRLSEPVTIGCEFAQIFSKWVVKDVQASAREQLGTSLNRLVTGPGYQCRRRNNKPDGKLSEHALGKAVDVTTFQTAGGMRVSVETDWGEGTKASRFLRDVHEKACARFTTVLGPEADPHHKSHFHLDIGCHGKDCTYLICQ